MAQTITSCSRPGRCPACGSKHVENILYAKPVAGKSVSRESSDTGNMPKWRCAACGVKIYLRTSRRCRAKTR